MKKKVNKDSIEIVLCEKDRDMLETISFGIRFGCFILLLCFGTLILMLSLII